MPYCDISGECILFKKANSEPKNRPRCPIPLARLLGSKTKGGWSVARCIMFKKFPEAVPLNCVVATCNHPRCVAYAHIQIGMLNTSRSFLG